MKKRLKNLRVITLALTFIMSITFLATNIASAIPGGPFSSAFESRKKMREAALALNERIVEEGSVLLKNDSGLPLKKDAKVTIFGKNSVNLVYQGSGSSGTAGSNTKSIYEAFENTNIKTNPYAQAFYENHILSGIGRPTSPTFGNIPAGIPVGETRATGDMFYGSRAINYPATGNLDATIDNAWSEKAPLVTDLQYDPANNASGYSNYNVNVTVGASSKNLRNSYEDYNDAAIIIISRVGGEGYDLPRTMRSSKVTSGINYPGYRLTASGSLQSNAGAFANVANNFNADHANTVLVPGARSMDDNYLQLDLNETNLIKEAAHYFDNVIVVLNMGTSMELGFLDDPTHYAYSSKIKGCVWMGTPGENGIMALPRLLNGDVNPSGNAVDTFYRNFDNDPTMFNFANNNVANGNQYTVGGAGKEIRFVDYQEDIYMGYRYYETRYAEILKALGKEQADLWYSQNVVAPFGANNSYTTFSMEVTEWTVDGKKDASNSFNFTGISEILLSVKVTNTGTVAGKKTVQIYGEAPYTPGGIEKSAKVFVGYEKTKLLKPAETQTLTIKVPAYYLASFDWNDANGNNFKGYELESGNYNLFVANNAHDSSNSISFKVNETVLIQNDPLTGNSVTPQFEYMGVYMKEKSVLLSRNNNFENYNTLTTGDTRRAVTQEFINEFLPTTAYAYTTAEQAATSLADVYRRTGAPIIEKEYPTTQTTTLLSYDETTIKFADMYGIDYDSPLWDAFLDQLTWQQMQVLIGGLSNNQVLEGSGFDRGASGVTSNRFFSVRLDNVGKPAITHLDGPIGWSTYTNQTEQAVNLAGTRYLISQNPYEPLRMASTCLVAATMDKDLQYEVGLMLGEDALWGYDHMDSTTISGGYAPAANLHRTPFSGRNFEYFSEDGTLSGLTMGQMIKGLQDKGVMSFIKHYFLNDQEVNRDTNGLATWTTEQAMREIYARAFEIAIKEAVQNNPKLMAIMTAFNRIGNQWAGGSYEAMTVLPRHEWGFRGDVITDWTSGTYMQADVAIVAGNDKALGVRAPNISDFALNDPTYGNSYKWAIRTAAKNILFADVNSNGIVHTKSVRTTSVDLTRANNNNSGEATRFRVGKNVNFNLKTDVADLYKAHVLYGDKDLAVFTYSLADGYNLPKGLYLTKDGRIVGTPILATGGTATVKIMINATGVNTSYYQGEYGENVAFDKRGEEIIYNTGIQYVTFSVDNPSVSFNFDGKMIGTAELGKEFTAPITPVTINGINAEDYAILYFIKPGYALPNGLILDENNNITGIATGTDFYTAYVPITARIVILNDTDTYTSGEVIDIEAVYTLQVGGPLQGPEGPPGADGIDGKDGTNGIDGKDGVNGKDGTNGIDGKDGINGKDGTNGVDGKDGINGKDGANGKDGTDGAIGPAGPAGADGKDGSGCSSALTGQSSLVMFSVLITSLGLILILKRSKRQN